MGSLNFIIVFKLISPRDEKWFLNHPTGQFPPASHHIIRQTAAYSLCLLLRNRRIRLALPAALLPSLPPSPPFLLHFIYFLKRPVPRPATLYLTFLLNQPVAPSLPASVATATHLGRGRQRGHPRYPSHIAVRAVS